METFGERLKRLRLEKNETLEELGKAIGTTKQYLSNIETGKKTPGKVLTQTMADHFNVDLDYMYCRTDIRNSVNLTGIFQEGFEQGKLHALKNLSFTNVPIYSCLSCGTGSYIDDQPEDIVSIPCQMMFSGSGFANFAEGDSMEPGIHNGDLLIFQTQPVIPSGSIGSFSLNGEYFCKRFKRLADGSCWLFSDNPNYDPIPIRPEDNFRALGLYKLKLSKEQ